MKLTPEQLVDWFLTARGDSSREAREEYFAMLKSPPPGARRSQIIAGLKQGVSEVLADMACRTKEERVEIDAALARRRLPSPEPTTMAVTIRAPSRTARASHGRGSS